MSEHNPQQSEIQQAAETMAVATTEASGIQTRGILRVILIVLTVAAFIWGLYLLEGVILLVVLAIFFAYLISPLVQMVQRPFKLQDGRERMMPRAVAIGIVYLLIFGSIGIALYLLVPRLGTQMNEFVKQSPAYLTNARARAASLNRYYESLNLPIAIRDEVNEAVTGGFDRATTYIEEETPGLVAKVLFNLPFLILIPILAFFLLKDADSFRRSALQLLPRGRLRWRGDEFFQDVNSTLAAYIRAQLTACLLIGVICSLGFFLLGVPYWLALGIIAGLFEFIPLAGPLVVAVLAALVASFNSPALAAAVLAFLAVLRIVHDYVIYPRIIGQGIHLHPLAVVLAILCGEQLAGLAGIFLAIPVVAIVSVTYRHWMEHRGSSGLVADLLQPAEAAVTAAAATPQPQASATPASGVSAG
ncbi:MAG: AI-2E family transporter [Pyrinomonadaceae bacterium]|nr:AI-2E family transporter [Pyrinomonadaceae bacterium]MDQ3133531.1 AI-2E family transporter [Acidobacteriota bacterium]